MRKLKQLFRFIFPASWVLFFQIAAAYRYDFRLYYRHSASRGTNSPEKLMGDIIRRYHMIEKGLTMPEPRTGFGKEKITALIRDCHTYIERYGRENEQLIHAIGVIWEYRLFHDERNHALDPTLIEAIDHLKAQFHDLSPARQRAATSDDCFREVDSDFPAFSCSRCSIRNYTGEEIPQDLMLRVIDLSRNTPSACNRQTYKSYLYTDRNRIRKILEKQGGNNGFGHLANRLIVITAELGVFSGTKERMQAYIDGGMYAMNLLYSLHYHRIAACILNCSHAPDKDKELRKLCRIKASEVFIAMITCGFAPDSFRVASSKRNSLNALLTVIED